MYKKSVIHHEIDVVWTVSCLKPHIPDTSVWIKSRKTAKLQLMRAEWTETLTCSMCWLKPRKSRKDLQQLRMTSSRCEPEQRWELEQLEYVTGSYLIHPIYCCNEHRRNGTASSTRRRAEARCKTAHAPIYRYLNSSSGTGTAKESDKIVILKMQQCRRINLKLELITYSSTCSYHRHSK